MIFHCIGQGINYAISILLWIIERIITRSGFVIVAFWTWDLLIKITKQILNEKLIGTSYFLPKEEWINWKVVGEIIAILIAVLIIALVTQYIGETLEALMHKLRCKQDKELKFNNSEIGKMLFFVWCLFAITFALINLINLFEFSIIYVLVTFALDLIVGWFLFVLSVELEPNVLLLILYLLPSGASGSGGSGGSGGTYVIVKVK